MSRREVEPRLHHVLKAGQRITDEDDSSSVTLLGELPA
jgi:hypothetical protein